LQCPIANADPSGAATLAGAQVQDNGADIAFAGSCTVDSGIRSSPQRRSSYCSIPTPRPIDGEAKFTVLKIASRVALSRDGCRYG
jgi:hypothetical protein